MAAAYGKISEFSRRSFAAIAWLFSGSCFRITGPAFHLDNLCRNDDTEISLGSILPLADDTIDSDIRTGTAYGTLFRFDANERSLCLFQNQRDLWKMDDG
jgi:hypothetical protein